MSIKISRTLEMSEAVKALRGRSTTGEEQGVPVRDILKNLRRDLFPMK